jgi:uncharacterized protein YkwD
MTRLPLFLAALAVSAGLALGSVARADPASGDVLSALNRARTDPAGFVTVLQQHRARLHDKRYLKPGTHTWIITQEGAAAVDEAIEALRHTPPLPPLTVNPALALAALDHVTWQGPRGEIGHQGDGGASPSERLRKRGVAPRASGESISYGPDGLQIVIDLIVDDGVPSRGHRKTIFNPRFQQVGIAIGPHRRYGTMCVMDFASAP